MAKVEINRTALIYNAKRAISGAVYNTTIPVGQMDLDIAFGLIENIVEQFFTHTKNINGFNKRLGALSSVSENEMFYSFAVDGEPKTFETQIVLDLREENLL